MSDPVPEAVVTVQSPWWSRTNWVQVGGIILNTATALVSGPALGLTPEEQVKTMASLNAIQAVATMVIRIWFTTTVTPQAAYWHPTAVKEKDQ